MSQAPGRFLRRLARFQDMAIFQQASWTLLSCAISIFIKTNNSNINAPILTATQDRGIYINPREDLAITRLSLVKQIARDALENFQIRNQQVSKASAANSTNQKITSKLIPTFLC